MDVRIGIDYDVLRIYLRIMSPNYKPVSAEEIAIDNLFHRSKIIFELLPSVRAKCKRTIQDYNKEIIHSPFLIDDNIGDLDENAVRTKAEELSQYCGCQKRVCSIVAEAELAKLDILLTLNDTLAEALATKTGYVTVMLPQTYCEKLKISENTPIVRSAIN